MPQSSSGSLLNEWCWKEISRTRDWKWEDYWTRPDETWEGLNVNSDKSHEVDGMTLRNAMKLHSREHDGWLVERPKPSKIFSYLLA